MNIKLYQIKNYKNTKSVHNRSYILTSVNKMNTHYSILNYLNNRLNIFQVF